MRSLRRFFASTWMRLNTIIDASKVTVTFHEKPSTETPSAVPAAGGCSVSKTTMMKIESPTASEQISEVLINSWRNGACGIRLAM